MSIESTMYQTRLLAIVGAIRKICDRFDSLITNSSASEKDLANLRNKMNDLLDTYRIQLGEIKYEGEPLP